MATLFSWLVNLVSSAFLLFFFLFYTRNAWLKFAAKKVGMSSFEKDQDFFQLPSFTMCGCLANNEDMQSKTFVVRATQVTFDGSTR
jgi:hypothetical protein